MDIVLDIGGTNSRLATVSPDKSLGEMVKWDTPADFNDAMKLIGEKIESMGVEPGGRTVAGVAGLLDRQKKKITKAGSLVGWQNQPLALELAKITQGKVRLENDAALAALGEGVWGSGRRKSIVGYITVSTGIGGARVVEGKIDVNAMGFEPGHQIISVDGNVGYWEDFASGRAMERVYGKKPMEIDDQTAWDNECRLVAIGLHNLTVIWSPEVIILGGGVGSTLDLEVVKKYMTEMSFMPSIPEIIKSELGDKAGLYGAMTLIGSPEI